MFHYANMASGHMSEHTIQVSRLNIWSHFFEAGVDGTIHFLEITRLMGSFVWFSFCLLKASKYFAKEIKPLKHTI